MGLKDIIDNKTIKIILLIILIMIPIYAIFIYASLSPGVNSYVHFEDKMYYSKKVDNNITTITITSYITNDGISDSGDIRVKIFVEDKQGISHSEAEKEIGSIASHKTKEVLIDVVVSESESYNVDALMFEDDERIVSSEGGFTAPAAAETKETGGAFSPDEEREDGASKDFSTPGFGILEVVVIAFVFTIFLKKKKRIKK
jgi:hypothetical protein